MSAKTPTNTFNSSTKPFIFVSAIAVLEEFDSLKRLKKALKDFEIRHPESESLEPSNSYILVDCGERVTRQGFYKISNAGGSCLGVIDLLTLQFPPADIIDRSVHNPVSKWMEAKDQEILPLDTLDGFLLDIFEAQLLRSQERDAINKLRGRVELSEYKFDNDYLKPLKAEFENVNATVKGNVNPANLDAESITGLTSSVLEILEKSYPYWEEIERLEALRLRSNLSNKAAFEDLVKGLRSKIDDVNQGDTEKINKLIHWAKGSLDFKAALPSMEKEILHDAKVLNIDPIGIWQYLLPAVLSLAGKKIELDIDSHTIPAIVWSALIAESGSGKTRAEKLVTIPLKKLQKESKAKYQKETEEYQKALSSWKADQGEKPTEPLEKKYLFNVATIQAVMKRLAEQELNGSLWARDELVGLFQSLGQFNSGKGESEALSCLLDSWDGGDTAVDRVNQADSYYLPASRLSIAGGIQPGIFKKCFSDPDDSQGLQARFLFAPMKPLKPKRTKGHCLLSEKLPKLYHWLTLLPQGQIKLSPPADKLYDKLYESIGEQAIATSLPVIRAWMFKLPAQLLRIALGLHLIECFHDDSMDFWQIQTSTLERAVIFAQYYRASFAVVQTTASDTSDVASILVKIWDKAVAQPDGLTARDAYRALPVIQSLAKESDRPVQSVTADLFTKLGEMGKGQVVRVGRVIKFVATLSPTQIQNTPESQDILTVAETPGTQGLKTSMPIDTSSLTKGKDAKTDPDRTEETESDRAEETEETKEETKEENQDTPESQDILTVAETPGTQGLKTSMPIDTSSLTKGKDAKTDPDRTEETEETKEENQDTPKEDDNVLIPDDAATRAFIFAVQNGLDPVTGEKEVDYDSFPHHNDRAVWGVKKETANRIKRGFLAIASLEDFKALQKKHPAEQLDWVQANLLSVDERSALAQFLQG